MKLRKLAPLLAMLMLLSACFDKGELPPPEPDKPSQAEPGAEFTASAFGVTLSSRPDSVVSLSPAITEKLSDLGLSGRLSGVSRYCDTGPDAAVPCGTLSMPDLKAIRGLSPNLLLTEAPLSASDMAALAGTGVDIAIIPRAATVNELLENYRGLAILLEGQEAGTELGDKFADDFQSRLDGLKKSAPAEPPRAVYLRQLTYTVATGDTLENALMQAIGLRNIAEDKTGWEYHDTDAKSTDGLAAFQSIDYIYCYKPSVTMAMLEQSGFWKDLDAVRKDRYLYVDAIAFERQTLRMLDELTRMQQYAKGEIPGSKGE